MIFYLTHFEFLLYKKEFPSRKNIFLTWYRHGAQTNINSRLFDIKNVLNHIISYSYEGLSVN